MGLYINVVYIEQPASELCVVLLTVIRESGFLVVLPVNRQSDLTLLSGHLGFPGF